MNSISIKLNCGIGQFLRNSIPKEYAIIWLSDLGALVGKNFELDLKTHNVFNGMNNGKERGKIKIRIRSSVYESERIVENGAICLSFLFFSNALKTKAWVKTPRRGEHWDYWCINENGQKVVVEVGGRTGKNGAKKDLMLKKKRFGQKTKRKEAIYISSIGFRERDHIVCKYC
ncbi:MAG: hypothetical protein ACXABG_14175 [Promethearchaeota archaeon]|jgi:hypothetical protein